MRRHRTRLTAIVLLTAVMSGCDGCDEVGPSSLTVITQGPIELQVGQSSTIRATAQSKGSIDLPSFLSNNTAVATVDSLTGRVTCIAQGSTTISIFGGGVSQTITVNCTPAILIDVTPTAVPFTHSVGITACPQPIGTLKITNLTGAAITATLTPSNAALTLGATNVTVPANGSVDVAVAFNCSVQTGFTANIIIVASNGVATDSRTVAVTANINR